MAPPTTNTELTDQLLALLLPTAVSGPRLRRCKDAFSRRLKHHNYARTNQFEVEEKFDVLQEKLQILNNDELADAIYFRLAKLKRYSEKWLPDVLDLVLRLSDEPIRKTKVEWLAESSSSPKVESTLTWADFEAGDPVDRNDQIWKVTDYSDLSSDDYMTPSFTLETDHSCNEERISLDAKLEPVDIDSGARALNRLCDDQFWRNVSVEPIELTELQVIRETVFMLLGLPTALFWKIGSDFEIDRRLQLQNVGRETFLDVLSQFGQLAGQLDLIRSFVDKEQLVPFLQTLRCSLQRTLQRIDSHLCIVEQNLMAGEAGSVSTLLQLSAAVKQVVELSSPIAGFVNKMESGNTDTIQCLELLYDQVSQTQAIGDLLGFETLSSLFFQSFETYFKPLRAWMDQGTLPQQQEKIFITAYESDQNLSRLWQKWYELADCSDPNRCPTFLKSVEARIFNTGKSVGFLKRLDPTFTSSESFSKRRLEESIRSKADPFLSFSEHFEFLVDGFVESRLRHATSRLREQLGNNCGLWRALDALVNVYFGKNGHITDLVDTKVFTAIDKCNKNWNDRFLLGDLLKTVFEPISSVDVDRLAVKSPQCRSRTWLIVENR